MSFIALIHTDLVRDLIFSYLSITDISSVFQTSQSCHIFGAEYINSKTGLHRLWGPLAVEVLQGNKFRKDGLTNEEIKAIVLAANNYALCLAASIDLTLPYKMCGKHQVSAHITAIKKTLFENIPLHKSVEMFIHCVVLSAYPVQEQAINARSLLEYYARWIRMVVEQLYIDIDDMQQDDLSTGCRFSMSVIMLKLSILKLTHLTTQPLEVVVDIYRVLWSILEVDRLKSCILLMLFMPLIEPFTLYSCFISAASNIDEVESDDDEDDPNDNSWQTRSRWVVTDDKLHMAESSICHLAEHVKLIYQHVAPPVRDARPPCRPIPVPVATSNEQNGEDAEYLMSVHFYNLLHPLIGMMAPWTAGLLLAKCGDRISLQFLHLLFQQMGFLHCRKLVTLYMLFIYYYGGKKSLEKAMRNILRLYQKWLSAGIGCSHSGLDTFSSHIVEACHSLLLTTHKTPYISSQAFSISMVSMYEEIQRLMLSNI